MLQLWPLSQGELAGRTERFIDTAFNAPRELAELPLDPWPRQRYLRAIVDGGFPEALRLAPGRVRQTWFDSYALTVTMRDLVELADVRRPADLMTLLRYAAASTARTIAKSELSPKVGIERHRLTTYLGLLETAYLICDLPAWSRDPAVRIRRHPKMMMVDTGLAAHLVGVDLAGLEATVSPMRGQLLETVVHAELQRARSWSSTSVSLSHWRSSQEAEVGLLLETPDGRVVGVEVKAASSVTAADTSGLRSLAVALGTQYVHGVVLHLGDRTTRFGPDITAIPLCALWQA